MQLALHAGAHFTEEERLLKSLLTNREALAEVGVVVPGPGTYRKLFRDLFGRLDGAMPTPSMSDMVMDAILDGGLADRLVLSHANLFGAPRACLRDGQFYLNAEVRIAQIRQLFPRTPVHLFMALRDPATFLPSVLSVVPQSDMDSLLRGADPADFRWSNLVTRLRRAHPDLDITIWCNEDAPIVWEQALLALSGFPADGVTRGRHDLLHEIVTPEGKAKIQDLVASPPDSLNAREHAAKDILTRFAREDALDEVVDVDGWDDALVEELSDAYDDDIDQLARRDDITLILPKG